MNALEAEAMLVRYDAAIKGLEFTDLEGRIEILLMITHPSSRLLEISTREAESRGVSRRAKQIAVSAASADARERAVAARI